MDSVDSLVEKGIVERYVMGDGEIGLRLTDKGRKYAEYLEIKELAKEDMGIEKYRKSENRRSQNWG